MNYAEIFDQYHKLLNLYMSLEVHDEFMYKKLNALKGHLDSVSLITLLDRIEDIAESIDQISDNTQLISERLDEIKESF